MSLIETLKKWVHTAHTFTADLYLDASELDHRTSKQIGSI